MFSILIKVPGFESLKEVEESRECEEGVRECVTLFLEMLPGFALVVPLRTARDLPRLGPLGLIELLCEPSRVLLILDLEISRNEIKIYKNSISENELLLQKYQKTIFIFIK